jgi:hypothetical protein
MELSIRQIAKESKLCQEVSLDMVTDLFPVEVVMETLQADQILERRERRLNLCTMVYVLIGWGLFADLPLREVIWQLTHGVRLIWPEGTEKVPVPSAFTRSSAPTGLSAPGSADAALLPSPGPRKHAWGLSLWLAFDGSR